MLLCVEKPVISTARQAFTLCLFSTLLCDQGSGYQGEDGVVFFFFFKLNCCLDNGKESQHLIGCTGMGRDPWGKCCMLTGARFSVCPFFSFWMPFNGFVACQVKALSVVVLCCDRAVLVHVERERMSVVVSSSGMCGMSQPLITICSMQKPTYRGHIHLNLNLDVLCEYSIFGGSSSLWNSVSSLSSENW